MLGIVISAALLMVLVKVVASEDADPEFWSMVGVALVMTVAGFACEVGLGETLGPAASLPSLLILPPLLIYCCGISFKQAMIVSALYFGVLFALGFGLAMLMTA